MDENTPATVSETDFLKAQDEDNNRYLRVTALEHAVKIAGGTNDADRVVAAAERFYAFLTAKAE